MGFLGGSGRQIDYNDEWNSAKFHQNTLYQPKLSSDFDDYDQIPLPELRDELESQFKGLFNRKTKQDPPVQPSQPFSIALLLQLLLGGNRPNGPNGSTTPKPTTTKKTTTKSTTTMSTTPDPSLETLSMRTRRPTKYKHKGNCKHPKKKHDKENEEDAENDSGSEDDDDSGEK